MSEKDTLKTYVDALKKAVAFLESKPRLSPG
jgi:hypothetical protein